MPVAAGFCFNQENLIVMEALVAIFSILYIFWPGIILFGIRHLFSRDLAFKDRLRLANNRVFIAWIVWAFFFGFIYWQGRRPVLLMPESVNHLLFWLLGVITGSISLVWMVFRWRDRWIDLEDNRTLEDLLALSPGAFEALVAALFKAYGHQAQVSGGSSDHGVDVVVYNDQGEKWIVQCKRYSGSVGEPVVRDLYGTMQHEEAQRAYLITTGNLTARAVDWAVGKPIVLYDGNALVNLIRRTQKRISKVRR